MKLKDILEKTIDDFSAEELGYKLYPNAKYRLTKERCEEFSQLTEEELIDSPYFLNMKWNGSYGIWNKNKEILLELYEARRKKPINTFVYTGAIGIGKCQHKDALINTNKGFLTMEELYRSRASLINTELGIDYCVDTFDEGIQNTIKLTCHSGAVSETSPHHKLRVLTEEFKVEWKEAKDIEEGDYLIRISNLNNLWGNRKEVDGRELTKPLCQLIGFWIAEGCYDKKSTAGAMLYSEETKEEVDKLLDDAKIDRNYKGFSQGTHTYFLKNWFGYFIKEYSKTGAGNKEVPLFIRETTKENICAFLCGLFSGDGSFCRQSIEYSSKSKKLVSQISQLLWALGIKSRMRKKIIMGNPYYILYITNKRSKTKFKNLIGGYFERRVKMLEDVCYEEVCHRDNDREIIPLLEFPWRDTTHPLLKKIVEEDWWLDPVDKKEESRNHLYDLTAEEDHTYIANGFINHNTTIANVITYIDVVRLMLKPDINSYYSIQPGKMFAFVTLSRDAISAKRVTFLDMLPVFSRSPFIQDYFPPHLSAEKLQENPSKLPSELRFPRNIVLFPGTGSACSALGYNIFSGIIDEANDLQMTVGSKKALLQEYYSAAEAASREMLERINSRFNWNDLFRQGKERGILTLIGQSRTPDSFLEKKVREAQMLGTDSTVFWKRMSRWEVQPKERFSRETFLFDITNKKIIQEIPKERCEELNLLNCSICGSDMLHGGYLGNKNTPVCSLDCYKESYGNVIIEKEKA